MKSITGAIRKTLATVDGRALLAAYVCLLCLLYAGITYYPLRSGGDEHLYLFQAQEFQQEVWPFWKYKFGYPLLLSAVSLPFDGDVFLAARIVAFFSSTLFVFAIVKIFHRLFDGRLALATGLAILTSYDFIKYSMRFLTDVPFACLVALSILSLTPKRVLRGRHVVVAGILGGYASVTRDNGIVLLALPVLWFLLFNVYHLPVKRRLLYTVLYAAPLLLLTVSYLWIPIVSLLQGDAGHVAEFLRLDVLTGTSGVSRTLNTVRSTASDPIHRMLSYWARFITSITWLNRGIWQPIPFLSSLALAIGGAFLWARDRRRTRNQTAFVVFLLLFIATTLVVPLRYPRFYLFVWPGVCFFVARLLLDDSIIPDLTRDSGWKKVLSVTRSRQVSKWAQKAQQHWPEWLSLKTLLLLLLFVVGARQAVLQAKTGVPGYQAHLQDIARWFEEQPLTPGERQGEKAMYAFCASFLKPYLGPSSQRTLQLIDRPAMNDVRQFPEGASYLIYHDGSRPLAELDDPLKVVDNLEIAYFEGDFPRAIVYRVLEENHVVSMDGPVDASSSDGQHFPPNAADGDCRSIYSSEISRTPYQTEYIILDLGAPKRINRLWIMPAPGGLGFPIDFQVQVGSEDSGWKAAVEERGYPPPWDAAQVPQVFSFPEVETRFVGILAARLGKSSTGEGYALEIAEVRLSLAREDPEPPPLRITPSDLTYDPVSGVFSARVFNEASITQTVTLRAYNQVPIIQNSIVISEVVVVPAHDWGQMQFGQMWPTGSYTVTVKATIPDNLLSRSAQRQIWVNMPETLMLGTLPEIMPDETILDVRAVLKVLNPVSYRLGNEIALVDYKLDRVAKPGQIVHLWLTLRRLAPVEKDLAFFAELVDGEGNAVQEWIWGLGPDERHVSSWKQWVPVTSRFSLYVSPRTEASELEVRVGMLDQEAMERLPAWNDAGVRLVDDAIPLEVIQITEWNSEPGEEP